MTESHHPVLVTVEPVVKVAIGAIIQNVVLKYDDQSDEVEIDGTSYTYGIYDNDDSDPHFSINVVTTSPGTRWEPPDCDVSEVMRFPLTKGWDMSQKLAELVASELISNRLDSYGDQLYQEQVKKDERDYQTWCTEKDHA